ncbi:MAG: type III pantothenate kinase [Planctomycetes bacterium]|nr:type III pantothenate kinase [Planctomycetota bacterium]
MSGSGRPLLTIDRGNSTLDCRLASRDAVRRARLDPGEPGAFDRFLADHTLHAAVGLSVVRGGLDSVRTELARRGVALRVAGEDLPCPLAIGYDDPRQLGVDRWVAALAAQARFGDALVVDCGTAVTFCIVTCGGAVLPGPIGPGLRTLADGLSRRAPALPGFDFVPAGMPLPRATIDAVRFGVGGGFAALVDGLAAEFAERAAVADLIRVATGGDAPFLLATSRAPWQHAPELVHEGLALLAGSP